MIPITDEIIEKAWQLRKMSCFTMREIAEKLNVNREDLMDAIEKKIKDSK